LPCAASVFAVLAFIAVRCSQILPCGLSLPCVLLAAHGNDFFAVRRLTALIGCTAAPNFPVVFLVAYEVRKKRIIYQNDRGKKTTSKLG
jgi:hypothetical protein